MYNIDLYLEYLVFGLVIWTLWSSPKKIQWNRTLLIACLGIVLLYLLITITVNLVDPSFFGKVSDVSNHMKYTKKYLANPPIANSGGYFYRASITELFRWTHPSYLIGSLYNTLFMVAFSLLLIRIAQQISLSNKLLIASLLGIMLWPVTLVHATTLMSEPLQLFLFSLTFMVWLNVFIQPQAKNIALAILLGWLLAYGHKGFPYYAPIYVTSLSLLLFAILFLRQRILLALWVLIFWFSVGAMNYFSAPSLHHVISKTNLADNNITHAAERYLQGGVRYSDRILPRASYLTQNDLAKASEKGKLYKYGYLYSRYMLEPSFSRLNRILDIIPYSQKLFRLTALALLIIALLIYPRWQFFSPNQRIFLALFAYSYSSMTLLMALGTFNYGQAMRHHIITDWLLALAVCTLFIQPLLNRAAKKQTKTG